MGQSTFKLQDVVDEARVNGDLSPAVPIGGFSNNPALSIANTVMSAMLLGGPNGERMNWKWNRINVPTFPTISYQQDYFVPGVVNVGWVESCWAVNINQTLINKQKRAVEVHKDLLVTAEQSGRPGKICWLDNRLLNTGTWGAAPLGPTANNPTGDITSSGVNLSGLQNPGAGVIYTNPIGQNAQPINATTCITDPNGNLWVLTQFGTCGSTEPIWPATNTIVYPTKDQPSLTATTVADGSVVWTAINPYGQGFRMNPCPPQNGVVWVLEVVAQARIVKFSNLNQTIDPVPDDYVSYFRDGFFAQCYRKNPDPKVRARFSEEWGLWLKSLSDAFKMANREMDDFGFYPSKGVMDTGYGVYVGPAYPWPNAWGN